MSVLITVKVEAESEQSAKQSYPTRETLAELRLEASSYEAWKVYRDAVAYLTRSLDVLPGDDDEHD